MKILSLIMILGTGGSFLPSSCTSQSDANEAKISELQGHLQTLATAVESQKSVKEQLERRISESDAQMKELSTRLKNAEVEKEKIQEALIKLEKEFSEYKERYKVSIQKKIPGLPLGEIEVEGKKYLAAEVRSISEDSIGLLHKGGVVRVKSDQLPISIREALAIDQMTPSHSETLNLLASLRSKREEHTSVTLPSGSSKTVLPEGGQMPQIATSTYDENALKSVAVISTDVGSGTGFIAQQGDTFYFYTNFHVIDGASSGKAVLSDGQLIVLPSEVQVADELEAYDLVRFRVSPPKGVTPLQIASSQDDVRAGEKIIALGNSGGAGVIPLLQGHIKATGPYAIEIDAEFVQGNSGGPVLRDGTHLVLGVVTKFMFPDKHLAVRGTRFDSVRRICLRPERIKKWRSTTIGKLTQEPKMIEQIANDNLVLKRLVGVRFTPQGISGIDSDSLLSGGYSPIGAAIAAELRATNAFLDRGKTKVAIATVKDHVGRWANLVRSSYGAGVNGVEASTYSRFNRDSFVQAAEERKAICANINQHLASEMTKLWQWSPQ